MGFIAGASEEMDVAAAAAVAAAAKERTRARAAATEQRCGAARAKLSHSIVSNISSALCGRTLAGIPHYLISIEIFLTT